jgi:hypothetical protein
MKIKMTYFLFQLLRKVLDIVHNRIDLYLEQNIDNISYARMTFLQLLDDKSFDRFHGKVDKYIQLKNNSNKT